MNLNRFQLIAADLDHWLSNIYFEVVRLPRYLAGQKEYEVELQFSSGLLNAPDRLKATEPETFDGDKIPVIRDSTLEISNFSDTDKIKSPKDLIEAEKIENEIATKSEKMKTITIGSRLAANKYAKEEGKFTTHVWLTIVKIKIISQKWVSISRSHIVVHSENIT